ncbi:MAG: hypothetical protein DRG11_06925 [Epsilonproteobacteria bacterium]|nr:MAG: hypothetical protein DRG11_06925 [Campylobacterota bacterium]
MDKNEILKRRFAKADKHYIALKEYKSSIDDMLQTKNIYDPFVFNTLKVEHRAMLDAYLKRFASLQDFLGNKIFGMLLAVAGIGTTKMSEVLSNIEKECIIDSLENWIEIRDVRNELEHDYPEELIEALNDLRYCIENFDKIEKYYLNTLAFFERHTT